MLLSEWVLTRQQSLRTLDIRGDNTLVSNEHVLQVSKPTIIQTSVSTLTSCHI